MKINGLIKKENKKYAGLLALLLFMLLLSLVFYRVLVTPKANGVRTAPYTTENSNRNLTSEQNPLSENPCALQLSQGSVYAQSFLCSSKEAYSVVLKFLAAPGSTKGETGSLRICLRDEDGNVLHQEEVGFGEIDWIHYRTLTLPQPVADCAGKKFWVEVEPLGGGEECPVYLELAADQGYRDGTLLVDGKEQKGDLFFGVGYKTYGFLKVVYWLLALTVVIGVLLLYYLTVFKKAGVHQIYLVTGIMLGILYCALIPPYTVPDEPVHFEESYDVANAILRTGKAPAGEIYLRECDANGPFDAYPSIDTYQDIYEQIFRMNPNNEIVQVKRGIADTNCICYVVPGIGITIGRLLHLGPVLTYWLARWLNYAVYLLLLYWAIKRMPFGKNCILIFSMLPMAMQQAMSASYDCIILGLGIWLLSQCLHMAFQLEKVSRRDLVLYCVAAAVMAGVKGGVYLPLCCLAVILPIKKFANLKQYFLSAGIVFIVVLTGFFAFNHGLLSGIFKAPKPEAEVQMAAGEGNDSAEDGSRKKAVQAETGAGKAKEEVSAETDAGEAWEESVPQAAASGWATGGPNGHYAASDILHYPKMYLKLLVSTVKFYGDFYLQGILGGLLGWFTIGMPWWLLFGFFGVLLFSTIEPNGKALLGRQKLWIVVIAGAVALLTMTGMMIMWTPVNSDVIEGVQGRYFLPVIPSLLLLAKNKWIQARKELMPYLLTIALCLELFACCYIFNGIA